MLFSRRSLEVRSDSNRDATSGGYRDPDYYLDHGIRHGSLDAKGLASYWLEDNLYEMRGLEKPGNSPSGRPT